ncbi:hypothetical protein TRIUR3_27332 [Triticum urartu]|uniref:Secreted protein n=1 Tax=Triticum urartu TaxID=4572 RepID=M8B2M6_TRIUA|nr:hypothetical protein TRIUR3_27332 [Triticum urartu]
MGCFCCGLAFVTGFLLHVAAALNHRRQSHLASTAVEPPIASASVDRPLTRFVDPFDSPLARGLQPVASLLNRRAVYPASASNPLLTHRAGCHGDSGETSAFAGDKDILPGDC